MQMADSEELYSADADSDSGPRLLAYLSRYLFWLVLAILLAGFSWLS